jgi:hypothetical protein
MSSNNNFLFGLEKAAAKSGGDKYICASDENFTIYVPQTISRKSGSKDPVKVLKITIETD